MNMCVCLEVCVSEGVWGDEDVCEDVGVRVCGVRVYG